MDEGEDEEEPVEVRIMDQTGTFSDIVVWGHEMVPDEEDAYRKGIEEWMGFAQAVSSTHTRGEVIELTRLDRYTPTIRLRTTRLEP